MTTEELVQMVISAVFMLLVGMSMPSIFKTEDTASTAHRMLAADSVSKTDQHIPNDAISPLMYAVHILVCSILLVFGKMFPTFC